VTPAGRETVTGADAGPGPRPPAGHAAALGRLAAPELDTTVANVARIYDCLLGGKDNFAADRAAAETVMREIPHSALACSQNRGFLPRVVRALADAGIRQFLDIGSGLPTRSNVHEIAQRAAPACRVVYVDYDRVVVAHARALLEKGSPGVLAVEGDLRDPRAIIGKARALIDFSEPVDVLLFAVLHFLTDAEQPREVVRALAEALAPGSAVALSHITDEGVGPDKGLARPAGLPGRLSPGRPPHTPAHHPVPRRARHHGPGRDRYQPLAGPLTGALGAADVLRRRRPETRRLNTAAAAHYGRAHADDAMTCLATSAGPAGLMPAARRPGGPLRRLPERP
jgi:hypothetical protein